MHPTEASNLLHTMYNRNSHMTFLCYHGNASGKTLRSGMGFFHVLAKDRVYSHSQLWNLPQLLMYSGTVRFYDKQLQNNSNIDIKQVSTKLVKKYRGHKVKLHFLLTLFNSEICLRIYRKQKMDPWLIFILQLGRNLTL